MLLQLLSCQARVEQLEGLLADSEARMQQAQEQASVLAAERDAAARNLLRAEAELNDVSDYSTKMFRQVGGAGCRHTDQGPGKLMVPCAHCIGVPAAAERASTPASCVCMPCLTVESAMRLPSQQDRLQLSGRECTCDWRVTQCARGFDS